MNDTGEELIDSSVTAMRFTSKGVWGHTVGLLRNWQTAGWTAMSVFALLWVIAQTSIHFLGANLEGWRMYAAGLVFSGLVALARAIHVYSRGCPEGLESESTQAKRIAQMQRPHWEVRLARQLLQDRITTLDRQLSDLLDGRVFVAIEKQLDIVEYSKWAQLQLDNVKRMLSVAKHLVLHDFPLAISSKEGSCADPVAILVAVERIADLYAASVSFERHNQSVAPPEALVRLHDLQRGWTGSIRDGIQELFAFLDRMAEIDPKSEDRLEYTITFPPPPGADAFNEEIDRIMLSLREITHE